MSFNNLFDMLYQSIERVVTVDLDRYQIDIIGFCCYCSSLATSKGSN
jgi:hypothetical protein